MMEFLNQNFLKSSLKKITFWSVLFFSALVQGQENDETSTLKFNFICDHSQTRIIADQSIMVYVMSLDMKEVITEMTYCSRKEFSIPKGKYSIIIESSKYCTHVLENYEVTEEEQKIEVDLLKEEDPDCKDERNFEPHPTRFN